MKRMGLVSQAKRVLTLGVLIWLATPAQATSPFLELKEPTPRKYHRSRPIRVAQQAKKMNRYYFLREGDTPVAVSMLIFGSRNHAKELLEWTGGYAGWRPGNVVYYNSPDQPNDDKVSSFYKVRNFGVEAYYVNRGESLSTIGQKLYQNKHTWRELAWLNRMETPDGVKPGQKIWILPSNKDIKRIAHENPREIAAPVIVAAPPPPPPPAPPPAPVRSFAQEMKPKEVTPPTPPALPDFSPSVRSNESEVFVERRSTTIAVERTEKSQFPWTFPGIDILSPAGYGADWGAAFAGAGVQNRARYTNVADGSLGFGLGFGNARRIVGLEADVALFSLHDLSQGGLAVKVHRILPYRFGIAIGCENITQWGPSDVPQSFYGSISRVFFISRYEHDWFSAITLTAGVGNGRFLSEEDVIAGTNTVNAFGSIAFRIKEPVAIIADWSGQDLNVGLSITPLRGFGFFINPALADVANKAGDGTRFLLGIGISYIFT